MTFRKPGQVLARTTLKIIRKFVTQQDCTQDFCTIFIGSKQYINSIKLQFDVNWFETRENETRNRIFFHLISIPSFFTSAVRLESPALLSVSHTQRKCDAVTRWGKETYEGTVTGWGAAFSSYKRAHFSAIQREVSADLPRTKTTSAGFQSISKGMWWFYLWLKLQTWLEGVRSQSWRNVNMHAISVFLLRAPWPINRNVTKLSLSKFGLSAEVNGGPRNIHTHVE